MNRTLKFNYRYFPVGQGLFTAGKLNRRNPAHPKFVWVYDCGSTSHKSLITKAISEFGRWIDGHSSIDLLTLSHFDQDHISGICELIRSFRVKTLLLPYLSMERRVLAVLESGNGLDSEFLEFYLNPASFISRIEGPGVERILFVPGGPDGDPPPIGAPNDELPPSSEERGYDLIYKTDLRDEPIDKNATQPSFEQGENRPTVEMLAPFSKLNVNSFWEFVPYNDLVETPISEEFLNEVALRRDELLLASADNDLRKSLSELKRIYDLEFGNSSRKRNSVSLFLYSGPIYPTWRHTRILEPLPWASHPRWSHPFFGSRAFSKCSQLYTGDGYLDTVDRLTRLMNTLGTDRMSRIGPLQVMHHGAESNWHDGVALKINPLMSVFSSDPSHRKFFHPHPSVLRDFWLNYPIQVDKTNGLSLQGSLS